MLENEEKRSVESYDLQHIQQANSQFRKETQGGVFGLRSTDITGLYLEYTTKTESLSTSNATASLMFVRDEHWVSDTVKIL